MGLKTRRVQLTVNNPEQKQIDSDSIKKILSEYATEYYCFCKETGEEGTDHYHIYIKFPNPVSIDKLREKFANCHYEIAHGTSHENRDYIRKEGNYENSDKKETNHPESFYESGDCPEDEIKGKRNDITEMIQMVKDGASNLQIIERIPSFALRIPQIEQFRQTYYNELANDYREMTVLYLYGVTRSGKTSYCYQHYDKSEICSILDYDGNGIFDEYSTANTRVLLLDEFRSSIKFGLLLALCDGHPLVVSARFTNRKCLHNVVIIASNIPLIQQYVQIQREQPESWKALLKRITKVIHFYDIGKYREMTVEEYLEREAHPQDITDFEPVLPQETPFKEEKECQLSLPLAPEGDEDT